MMMPNVLRKFCLSFLLFFFFLSREKLFMSSGYFRNWNQRDWIVKYTQCYFTWVKGLLIWMTSSHHSLVSLLFQSLLPSGMNLLTDHRPFERKDSLFSFRVSWLHLEIKIRSSSSFWREVYVTDDSWHIHCESMWFYDDDDDQNGATLILPTNIRLLLCE